jgi:hypothetical protein
MSTVLTAIITYLFISNANSFKAQRDAILAHMKYTREPLNYRSRCGVNSSVFEFETALCIY